MSQPSKPTPGAPIPLPPDFPVVWQNPDDARRLWTIDRVHSGEVVPALMVSLSQKFLAPNFGAAAESYGMPLQMEMRHINAYSFTSVMPKGLPPESVQRLLSRLNRFAPSLVDGLMRRATAKGNAETLARMNFAADNLQQRWEREWLPGIRQEIAYWESMQLDGADPAALLGYLQETHKRAGRVWRIHFEIVMPGTLAPARFDAFYRELFPDSEELDSQRLLQGIDNSFLAADRAVWALSRTAATQPEVADVLLGDDLRAIPQALQESGAGQRFWAEMQAFLAEFGRRGQQSDGFREESWIENPTTALLLLRSYLRHPEQNPVKRQEELTAARERAVAEARARLADRDESTRARFEQLLAAAQVGMYLHEEHNFWIDQRSMYECRRLVQACAAALARTGVVSRPDDIWHMTLDEVEAGLAGQPQPGLSDRIAQRRDELEHFRSIPAPDAIGTTPYLAPPKDNPMAVMFAKMDGIDRRGEQHAQNELLGNAGSAGKVRGRARVIHDLADAHQLREGEILVARATMPPWTPLFSIAAGLITETGGMLSHAAVVAREYGIPAVVGVADATTRISTGSTVEIDGSSGRVRLL